ncbi:MAG TPA: hypothetical protein VMI33_15890 [Streptosporangiaceae bacterium]|nr:hypothetical protein [Streptosporangiaceae bacterium]
MTDTEDVERYADAILAMIKEDQDSGQVPRDVSTWDELDDSVDADDYFRQAHLPSGTAAAAGLRSAVTGEVIRRLAGPQGGPWGVAWTHPDGRSAEIGRTLGYATRAEAEAVGQHYLADHGGAYRVHGG